MQNAGKDLAQDAIDEAGQERDRFWEKEADKIRIHKNSSEIDIFLNPSENSNAEKNSMTSENENECVRRIMGEMTHNQGTPNSEKIIIEDELDLQAIDAEKERVRLEREFMAKEESKPEIFINEDHESSEKAVDVDVDENDDFGAFLQEAEEELKFGGVTVVMGGKEKLEILEGQEEIAFEEKKNDVDLGMDKQELDVRLSEDIDLE